MIIPMRDLASELMKDTNDVISATHFADFWEYAGVTVEIKETSRNANGLHFDLKINKGYLSPKAGAPC